MVSRCTPECEGQLSLSLVGSAQGREPDHHTQYRVRTEQTFEGEADASGTRKSNMTTLQQVELI